MPNGSNTIYKKTQLKGKIYLFGHPSLGFELVRALLLFIETYILFEGIENAIPLSFAFFQTEN